MACLLYNTGRCLQLRMFNCPNFGVHFISDLTFSILVISKLFFSFFFVVSRIMIKFASAIRKDCKIYCSNSPVESPPHNEKREQSQSTLKLRIERRLQS